MDTERAPRGHGVTLPELPRIPHGVMRGRVPLEGYQRGWGLQYGGLAEQVERDALYREAVDAMGDIYSFVALPKRMNLFLILTKFLDRLQHQNVIEFGAYRGGMALFMAYVLRAVAPAAKLYALDTFSGMPETDPTRDAHGGGDFPDASLEALVARRDAVGLTNLIPVQGLFQESFPGLAAQGLRFAVAHIDCDIYSGVKYAQDAVWLHMSPGGYLVFDDADVSSCLGAAEAMEELIMDRRLHSEQAWPHFVFRTGLA